MTIEFKEGVPQDNLSPRIKEAMMTLDDYLAYVHATDLVITSTSDGKHMKGSKHYDDPCNAIDVRIWNILERIVSEFKRVLGDDYDVVLEKDHIHVEYDPKD